MKAHVGDRIVLAAPSVEAPLRDGEVLEARGSDDGPPFLVRWSDGHVGLFFPGPGSVLRIGGTAVGPHGDGDVPDEMEAVPKDVSGTSERRRVHEWRVRITLFESDEETHANVVLLADSPQPLTARGVSTRNPEDRPVPEIGDEVAVARALRHLADLLLATAEGDIEQLTGERDVIVRAT